MTIKTAQQKYSSLNFSYLCTYYKYGHKYTFGYTYVKIYSISASIARGPLLIAAKPR